MYNILDYVYWRGDLPIENGSLTEADIVALSRLSYLPFDGKVSDSFSEQITLREAAKLVLADENSLKNMLWEGDSDLLRLCGESERFGNLLVSGFVNRIDNDRQMQFSAIVFELGNGTVFVSFRGTDSTFVGWQEDCNMYTMFPLPSQEESVAYLERVLSEFDGDVILGGHSKGGNLAMFSALFCSDISQKRILAVYNLDGPGFEKSAIEISRFSEIKDKVCSFVPQTSVFGLMLEHEEKLCIVRSNQKGFLQHDIYSWELDHSALVRCDELTEEGITFDRTLREFIGSLSLDEKRQLIDAIFDVLGETDGKTFTELGDNLFKDSGVMLKALTKLPSESRSLVKNSFGRLIKVAGTNFSGMMQNKRRNGILKPGAIIPNSNKKAGEE